MEAAYGHILSQTRFNVEFLIAHNQLDVLDGKTILTLLSRNCPSPSGSSPPPTGQLSSRTSTPSLDAGAPTLFHARALWPYNASGDNPKDISFVPGDIIHVKSELTADAWIGINSTSSGVPSRCGKFPTSYVEKLSPHDDALLFSISRQRRTSNVSTSTSISTGALITHPRVNGHSPASSTSNSSSSNSTSYSASSLPPPKHPSSASPFPPTNGFSISAGPPPFPPSKSPAHLTPGAYTLYETARPLSTDKRPNGHIKYLSTSTTSLPGVPGVNFPSGNGTINNNFYTITPSN